MSNPNIGLGTSPVIIANGGAAAVTLTLTASQSGSVVVCNNAAALLTVQLPTATPGLNFKCVLNTAGGAQNVAVSVNGGAGTGGMYGVIMGATTGVACINRSIVTFIAGTAIKGDSVSLYCDGTSWYVNAIGATAGAFTATA